MPRVQVGDVDVAYEVQGEGEPFVLLHGSTGGRLHWASVAPQLLDAGHQVVLPEYAGGGETTDPGGPLDIDDLAAQVAAAAADAGAERFHLAGWSLGAVTALVVAATHPERVRSLTLVSAWARTDARMAFTFDLWRRLFETDRELFARYTLADGLTRGGFEALGDNAHAAAQMAGAAFSEGAARHAELDARIDVSDRVAEVAAPTLVVHGVDDRWVDIVHGRDLAAALADARLVEVDCGHLVPTERADELARLLREHAAGSASAAGRA